MTKVADQSGDWFVSIPVLDTLAADDPGAYGTMVTALVYNMVYMDMEQEVPGPMLYTTEEVIDAIKNIDDISLKYKDKYEEFYRKYCSLEDGRAAERCVKTILGTEN